MRTEVTENIELMAEQLEEDMSTEADKCIALAVSRCKRYGRSVEIVKDNTLIDLVLMKLIRTREIPDNDPKRLDEVKDSVNYLLFLLMRGAKKND